MSLQQVEMKEAARPRSRVVDAILADKTITDPQRATLVLVYRSFQRSSR